MADAKRLLPLLMAWLSGSMVGAADIPPEVIQNGKDATAFVVIQNGRAFGSAFCIDSAGYFLTNEHVVAKEKNCELVLQAATPSERRVVGQVVRLDPKSDLALIKTAKPVAIPTLGFDRSDTLSEADSLATFGFPLGTALSLERSKAPSISVHLGRVTAIRRIDGLPESIQLDAQLNPGNSGGPVLNSRGLIVGVVRAKVEGTGLNLAIPMRHVETFLQAPVVSTEFPKVVTEGEAADFTVHLTSFFRPLEQPVVEIETSSAVGDKTVSRLQATDQRTHTANLITARSSNDAARVGVEASFGAAASVRATAPNTRITIGSDSVALGEVSTVERSGGESRVVLRDGRRLTADSITGLPTELRLNDVSLQMDLSKADRVAIELNEQPSVDYTLRVKDGDETVAEQSGQIPIHGRKAAPPRRPSTPASTPAGSWAKLGESPALPSYLMVNAPLRRTSEQGVRLLEEEGAIQSVDRTLLTRDFVFEALVTFEPDDRIAYLGLGPGLKDRSYNGLTDSLYLRLHAHTLGDGLVGMQNWNRGTATLGKISHPGIHRVSIEKQGDAVTFLVDPDNDGPSADDLQVTYTNLRTLAPYLTAKNCGLFLSGSGTFLSTRLEVR